ncbi:MAG: orotidine-5'-phosphate decarboxylase [Anaerolineales bacterium]|nr:orotidine-5'-phosphate decarboxylase [Anaerolineales bacterium]
METFFSFLERRVDDSSSLLCVGLDPHIPDLKEPTAASALDFCLTLVKQTAPYAAAFKPNAAFFEVFGAEGWVVLKQVIEAIHEESSRLGSMIPIILDAKRGDIASTANAYAQSAFENLGVNCITLNPYLGHDSIEPFIGNPEKGFSFYAKPPTRVPWTCKMCWCCPPAQTAPCLYIITSRISRKNGMSTTTLASSLAQPTRRL